MAPVMSSLPWPPFFQQWNRALPSLVTPGQKTVVWGSTPSFKAASATTIL